MNIVAIIAKIIGLIPSAVEAGRAIANAIRPEPKIDPNNMMLWHSVTYGRGLMRCITCGEYVEKQNVLCPEAVRRRKQRWDT